MIKPLEGIVYNKVSPLIRDIFQPVIKLSPLDLAPNDYVSDFLEKLNLGVGSKSMLDKSKIDIDDFNLKSASPNTKNAVSNINPLSDIDQRKIDDPSKVSIEDECLQLKPEF